MTSAPHRHTADHTTPLHRAIERWKRVLVARKTTRFVTGQPPPDSQFLAQDLILHSLRPSALGPGDQGRRMEYPAVLGGSVGTAVNTGAVVHACARGA
ncbi:hypothetical protein LHV13_04145 [Ferrovum sp. PN-J185]|uniref:hypothetical protein n=1 Tax=Ferrovum sp. PN-J185 TaxID=1356306 RepID=UPI0012E824C2|nr:hypothetical protein [Ferrovum sp. PN-J185]MCC6068368.1 hypothetical protein [Ferrovum sp. PN-J185]MDE1890867.1 hypothetical protein [Betaproteobacteria bacterium]MDE2055821.1 hypothetical protein [Betaproteobacteria bacterium]